MDIKHVLSVTKVLNAQDQLDDEFCIAITTVEDGTRIYCGQIGHIDGVRIVESPEEPEKPVQRHDWWNQNRKY